MLSVLFIHYSLLTLSLRTVGKVSPFNKNGKKDSAQNPNLYHSFHNARCGGDEGYSALTHVYSC